MSRTSLSNKSTRVEKPSEINICKDNLSAYVFYGNGESLSSATPDQQRVTRKKGKKLHTLR